MGNYHVGCHRNIGKLLPHCIIMLLLEFKAFVVGFCELMKFN